VVAEISVLYIGDPPEVVPISFAPLKLKSSATNGVEFSLYAIVTSSILGVTEVSAVESTIPIAKLL
jgi:hypothetical protein